MEVGIQFILILLTCFALSKFIISSNSFGSIIKNIFYVPCSKSDSGAVLLGGIPVAVGSAIAFALMSDSITTFLTWALPALVLVSIGYLDDKVEIKSYIKLSLQVVAVTTFAYFAAGAESLNFSLFGTYMVWGFGVLSGSNLLDGIDTYSIKYSAGTYLAFMGLALYFGQVELAMTSALLIAPMIAFYYFNKFPSKMHLGEIGGTIIGLNFLFLSAMFYKSEVGAVTATSSINLEILLLSLSIMHLPMTELGISLLRRLSVAKSPFYGDKLHLHYILAKKKSVGVIKAANILSSFHFQALAINIVVSLTVNPIAAFLSSGIFYVGYYLFFGFEAWSSDFMSMRMSKLDNVYPIRSGLKLSANLVGIENKAVANNSIFTPDRSLGNSEQQIAFTEEFSQAS